MERQTDEGLNLLSNQKANSLGRSFFRPPIPDSVPEIRLVKQSSRARARERNEQNKYASFGLSYKDFKEKLLSINKVRDAALFATIYCAYARVGEIVKGRYSPNPPITKDMIEVTKTHLIIKVLTEKTNQNRTVPSSIAKDGWLHGLISRWKDSAMCEYQMFPITTAWAEKLFERHFGTQRIHLLRHWACTHALQGHRTKERLPAQYVARLGGWKDLNTFYSTYSHIVTEDFIDMI